MTCYFKTNKQTNCNQTKSSSGNKGTEAKYAASSQEVHSDGAGIQLKGQHVQMIDECAFLHAVIGQHAFLYAPTLNGFADYLLSYVLYFFFMCIVVHM